jgi:hypothetical protein
MAGQIDPDRRAVSGLGVDLHVAAGLSDEAMHLAEAKTRALANSFGGEEGVEHPLDDVRWHPGPGVGDRNQDVLAGLDLVVGSGIGVVEMGVRGLHRQPAALRHGVARVDHQVEDRVLELALIDEGAPEPAGTYGLHPQMLADRVPQHLRHPAHQLVDVQRLWFERCLA